MKLLYVTTRAHAGGWLADAFAADSACDVVLEEAIGTSAALARLREEQFDAVLVTHEPDALDALDFVEGLRIAGTEDPLLVLGRGGEQELTALCYEVGADGYCCVESTTTRSLLWTVARAMQYHQLLCENRQLVQAQQQRLAQEHQEAERLLTQQRALIQELEQLRRGAPQSAAHAQQADGAYAPASRPIPESVVRRYRDMLRAYVIMGSGNMTREMNELVELLVGSGISAQRAMQLHVGVLEELIVGLGNRSARHVMNRADLLILEVMMHLSEGYRHQSGERPAAAPHFAGGTFAPQPEDLRHHRGYA